MCSSRKQYFLFPLFPLKIINSILKHSDLPRITPNTLLFSGILITDYNKLWETTCVNTMKNRNIYPPFGRMKQQLSVIVHTGSTGQQKRLISDRVYQTEQLHWVLSEKGSNLAIKSAREQKEKDDKFAFKLAQSAIHFPVWWHCRGQNSISRLLSSFSPSCSSLRHSTTSHKEETLDLMWTEANKKGQNPLPQDSTDLCFCVCVFTCLH